MGNAAGDVYDPEIHRCPDCGYQLAGIDSERCPECGYGLESRRLTEPQLAWPRRHELGSVRAYFRTVKSIIYDRKMLWEEVWRPVDMREARRFRWVTVGVTYLPLIPLSMVWGIFGNGWLASGYWTWMLLGHFGILMCIAGATEATSYAFYSKELPEALQRRVVALSYYCCAPLVLLPPAYLVGGVVVLAEPRNNVVAVLLAAVVLSAGYLAGRALVEWLLQLAELHRRTMHHTSGHLLGILLGVPISWLGVAVAALLVLLLLSYGLLMINSMLGS